MSKPVFPVPEVVPQRTLTKQGYSVTEDTYRCDDCNKTFRTSQGLKYHMMHHTGTCYFKNHLRHPELLSLINFFR